MKRGCSLGPLAFICLLTVSHTFARLGNDPTGAEAFEHSDVIVAVQTAGFEVIRRAGEEWMIFKPDALKAYKGAVPISEVRIKSFVPGEFRVGSTRFREGKLWLLFFLKDLRGGRYGFAFDPFFQGEVDLPSDVDPLQCAQIDDLLVALAESAARTDLRRAGVFMLLAGLPSEKARRCLSSLSQSQDSDVAMDAVAARIRGRDPEAFEAAEHLLKREDLPPPAKRLLEHLLQNHGLSKEKPSQPNL